MTQKHIHIANVGEVSFQKRKGTRSIRLTIGHDGSLRVSLPPWVPYKAGEAFVLSKQAWVLQQQHGKSRHVFKPQERIGKAHRLRFISHTRQTITSRVTDTELLIRMPDSKQITDPDVQTVVYAGAVRALKQESKNLLPIRLRALANQHGFNYRSVTVKHMKSRWGSCNSQKELALNCFLMQLPWELIDYVLIHELLHTRVMAHGKPFWTELGQYVTDLDYKRKRLKTYKPALVAQD